MYDLLSTYGAPYLPVNLLQPALPDNGALNEGVARKFPSTVKRPQIGRHAIIDGRPRFLGPILSVAEYPSDNLVSTKTVASFILRKHCY